MALFHSPRLPTKGLRVVLDVNNSKCVDASQSITSGTRLKNLIDNNFEFSSPYTDATTLAAMSFVQENGQYVYNQVSTAGGEPGWSSTTGFPRTNDYTFICWFKYNYGSAYQRGDNIYGGGFSSRTSFYLSPGGTSASHGLLRYSDAGGTNSYSVTGTAHGGNNGQWHMFCGRDYGPDGAHTSEFWLDGVLKQTVTSNTSYDTPDGNGTFTWGSWSTDYGNFGGRTNMYMYWDRALSGDEIVQVYNSTRGRFA